MRVGGQRHAPAALPPGKTWYSLYRRLGGPQGQSGWVQKISPPLGFHPQTVQPAASCYTDYTILAHNLRVMTKVNDKHNLCVWSRCVFHEHTIYINPWCRQPIYDQYAVNNMCTHILVGCHVAFHTRGCTLQHFVHHLTILYIHGILLRPQHMVRHLTAQNWHTHTHTHTVTNFWHSGDRALW